jgi:hypothetical protein
VRTFPSQQPWQEYASPPLRLWHGKAMIAPWKVTSKPDRNHNKRCLVGRSIAQFAEEAGGVRRLYHGFFLRRIAGVERLVNSCFSKLKHSRRIAYPTFRHYLYHHVRMAKVLQPSRSPRHKLERRSKTVGATFTAASEVLSSNGGETNPCYNEMQRGL